MSLGFAEELYAQFQRDPASVPADWRELFESLGPPVAVAPAPRPRSVFNPPLPRGASPASPPHAPTGDHVAALQERADNLVRGYRVRGHMKAAIDPLGIPRPRQPELEPGYYGLTEADLDRTFSSRLVGGPDRLTLRDILGRLQNTYCRSIGVQFMHILDLSVQRWLQDHMEETENRQPLTKKEQLRILTRLTDATIFEEFIQKKFLGAKSFSLEGAESLIPLLDLAIEKAASQGVEEIVFAMAHRGRLNVLANIMGKSPRDIFQEFDDADAERHVGRGDVKYHLGYSTDWKAENGRKVHLSLCFNPSHLEFVNPVALGRLRAKQDRAGDLARERGLAILIHGDAAFAGQGVTQETLNLSQLESYTTGGTIHVIVNNQLGFTTPPEEGRSTTYATEVARMLQVPIFHVNGEDPEAVARVVRLALDFRLHFHRDVVIDMYAYRRRGHNEADEPVFTQPLMYKAIENRKTVREGYVERLLEMKEITREEVDAIAVKRKQNLEEELTVARGGKYTRNTMLMTGLWLKYQGGPEPVEKEPDTGVPLEKLKGLREALTRVPKSFHVHPKLARVLEQRRTADTLDWATAELLAFASLAVGGHRIRLTGQDVPRGTFSQRHAVLFDLEDGHPFMPLATLSDTQAPVEIANSPLSEIGVLGFEYGYSLDTPDGLTAWEAQFGDFINVAQVIVDQFIVSAEDKWHRLSGIVLLLPHGFEGMGPEHSSARMERFLSLAAEDNIQVVNPTTPAQYFHVLRRQIVREWRKPLIVFTPKSLLRHPRATSRLEDLARGTFIRILPDTMKVSRPRRILCASGKIAVELEIAREERKIDDVAILRFEQLYPLRDETIAAALAAYPSGTEIVWVQEEPANMGAWPYLRGRFCHELPGGNPFRGVSRAESASPATGSASSHKLEQKRVIEEALGR